MFWTHGNRGLDRGIKKFLRVILFKWLGDGLFLYGHFQRNLMIEDGYDPNKLFVIFNSLQPEKQFKILKDISNGSSQDNNKALFQSANNFTLIFIGRLVDSKGVMNILKAMKSLKDASILVNCIFIGEGEEKEKMQTFCILNELNTQVYFAGALYDEESIAPYFVKADLMISPGNVGLNCIHALAYGVPVLTHNNFVYQNPK
ncbi:glycosyltransferase [Lacinutrix neustonica]|uniref:Glycosyltransferase n=1 Tax=Lacinutrix neustonica TaxID=2980107 RepID=A0A9E8MTF6_9FLAO|nr:glycosyltransferase [Lacinutrix neustonica]WAC01153.1 glycosyltransferase [Lacinutrix neustonica]